MTDSHCSLRPEIVISSDELNRRYSYQLCITGLARIDPTGAMQHLRTVYRCTGTAVDAAFKIQDKILTDERNQHTNTGQTIGLREENKLQ